VTLLSMTILPGRCDTTYTVPSMALLRNGSALRPGLTRHSLTAASLPFLSRLRKRVNLPATSAPALPSAEARARETRRGGLYRDGGSDLRDRDLNPRPADQVGPEVRHLRMNRDQRFGPDAAHKLGQLI
jgi:hypothetical protein